MNDRRRGIPNGGTTPPAFDPERVSAITQDAEEKTMKKLAVSLGRILFILLLLAGLSVCTMSDQSASSPPEDALSFDQLLANLDELQGTATQSPSAPGMSVFSLPDGSLFSSADLSAYINAIKRDLAAYIYSCTGGAPYLVVASKVPQMATGSTSGLVWVPFTWGRRKNFPIISLQHGTQVYRECAPSRFNANPLAVLTSRDLTGALQNYVECVVGALMASAGYIVVMPDYQGFGDSIATHPYVHLSLGNSVKDIVLWAQGYFRNRTVSANGNVYLTGYSEGGYTTMAGALKLQKAGIAVKKIVPCDGPYSLSGVMLGQMLSGTQVKVPSYLLYTASGYKAVYSDIPLSNLLTDEWAGWVVSGMFDGSHTNAYVSANVPADTIPAKMLDPVNSPALLASTGLVYGYLDDNNAWQGWTSSVKPVFVHCMADDVVPYTNATVAAGVLGSEIHWVAPIPFVAQVMGSIHVGAYPTAMLEAFKIIRN
jgi:pimeloyl-ACP methyl ester carboxylesterase